VFASNTTRTIPDDALILSYRNGKVELRFRSVRRAWGTEVSICGGDPKVEADWSLYTSTGKNTLSITGLDSGKEYFFRVVALGAAGASPASDVTSAKAA
jgi:hypothetical protein